MESIFYDIDNNYVKFENNIIRLIIDIDNKLLFNANDTASALGYMRPKETIKELIDKNEKIYFKNIKTQIQLKIKLHPQTIYLSESGLYSLIIHSRLPKAKKFKYWVTSEVLPSIRKYGSYKLKTKYETELEKILKDLNFLKKENEILKNDLKKECYPDGGIVYVIDYSDDENSVYRIGMTNCMNKRKSIYDTHSLHKKDVVHIIETDYPLRLESCIRSMLYEKRYKNNKDYFICSLKTIKRAFTNCLNSFECMNQERQKQNQKGGSIKEISLDNKFQNKILLLENKYITLKNKLKIINKLFKQTD